MKSLRKKIILGCVVISFLLTAPSSAQWCQQFWIKVADNKGSIPYTLLFGNHFAATNGYGAQKDSLNPIIIEREAPPCGTDLCVVWRPPWLNVNWGNGFLTYDFRGYIYSEQRDTFLLYFINPQAPDADITLTWPDAVYLGSRCNSMFMSESTGKISTIDMFSQSSITIPAAGDSGISKVYIYKSRVFIIDEYDECWTVVNEKFLYSQPQYYLSQNYPNPFNPTTSIKYQLPFNSQVKLKIYNVLGQTEALLTDEIQQAGFKSATWNANDAASGVYFYKLEAVSVSDPSKIFSQIRKMILIK
jgi:hypothetical protein